jgi:hypothetical protein
LTCKTCVYINQLWSTSLLKQLSNFMYWGWSRRWPSW